MECKDIWKAAEAGNVGEVRRFVAQGVDVDQNATLTGRTPLISAAWKGRVKVVEALLDLGAQIDREGRNRSNALVAACLTNNSLVALLLIRRGADVDKVGVHLDYSALHIAAGQGAIEVVSALVEAGASLEKMTKFGATALDRAVAYKREAVANLLRAAARDRMKGKGKGKGKGGGQAAAKDHEQLSQLRAANAKLKAEAEKTAQALGAAKATISKGNAEIAKQARALSTAEAKLAKAEIENAKLSSEITKTKVAWADVMMELQQRSRSEAGKLGAKRKRAAENAAAASASASKAKRAKVKIEKKLGDAEEELEDARDLNNNLVRSENNKMTELDRLKAELRRLGKNDREIEAIQKGKAAAQ